MAKTNIERLVDYLPLQYPNALASVTINEVLPPKTLHIIYDKGERGLHDMVCEETPEGDENIQKMIKDNLEEVFPLAICKTDEENYVLNIASVQNFGNFSWKGKWGKEFLNQQLTAYMPIIQKFMADVTTGIL